MKDKQSELQIISYMLTGKSYVDIYKLNKDDFYFNDIAYCFEILIEMDNNKKDISFITFRTEAIKKYDSVIIDNIIADVSNIGIIINVNPIIDYVIELSKKRIALNLSLDIKDLSNNNTDVNDIINHLENGLKTLDENRGNNFEPVGFPNPDDLVLKKEDVTPTGFYDVDRYLSGFIKTEQTVLAGRPGMGKSAWALTAAVKVAKTRPVLYFSLEMITILLLRRAVANIAKVDSNRIRNDSINDEERTKVIKACGSISKLQLYIDDSSYRLNSIVNKIKQFHKKNDLGLVVIDYLQLIEYTGKTVNRNETIGYISRALKNICNSLKIPILLLSQLNRNAEGHRPTKADLRESGAIEQDADNICFLHQDLEKKESNIFDFIIDKNRSGEVGFCELKFLKQFTKFENYDKKFDVFGGN